MSVLDSTRNVFVKPGLKPSTRIFTLKDVDVMEMSESADNVEIY